MFFSQGQHFKILDVNLSSDWNYNNFYVNEKLIDAHNLEIEVINICLLTGFTLVQYVIDDFGFKPVKFTVMLNLIDYIEYDFNFDIYNEYVRNYEKYYSFKIQFTDNE
jgi:hypothetical protein